MALVVNGWTLRYHPIFGRRYRELLAEVRRLQANLPDDEYRQHPMVKLAANVRRLITEVIPTDPDAPAFRLKADLAKFRRAKGSGLPPRYRLFFTFSTTAKTVIYMYLNDATTLRKEGASSDPYDVFRRLLGRGEIGADFRANLKAVEKERD